MSEKKLKKTEEYKTNRALVMFGAAALYLWVLSFLHRCLDNPMRHATGVVLTIVLTCLAAVGVVVCLIWHSSAVKKGAYNSKKTFNGLFCAGLLVLLAVCSGLLWYNHILGMRIIYLLIPATAILYLIYSAYQRECFTFCVTQCAVAFVLYVLSGLAGNMLLRVIVLVVGLAISLGVVALYLKGGKKGKQLHGLAGKVELFGKNTDRRHVLATYAIDAVLLLAAFFLGGSIAFYAALAVLLYTLAMLVYYTVKLM